MLIKCNNCQNDNTEEAKFCVECGTKLILHCQSCGKENPPNHRFCYECGHKLDEDIKKTEHLDFDKPERYIPKNLLGGYQDLKHRIKCLINSEMNTICRTRTGVLRCMRI